VVLSESTARQAAELRVLLRRGVFLRLRMTLPNGGTLPVETVAEVVFDDLDFLTKQAQDGGHVSDADLERLVRDLGRLHGLAIPSA
jgi:hypothetical protein